MKLKYPGSTMLFTSFLVVCFLLSFSLACRLTSVMPEADEDESSNWSRIFGSACTLFSGDVYEKADLYFHKGVAHKHDAAFNSVFQDLHRRIVPEAHVHADKKGEVLRIMPWLRLATRIDPHNIEAYCVAVYWLTREKRFDLASDVLREAMRKNPANCQLYTEKGLLAIKIGDREQAATAFDRALSVWPGDSDPGDEDARMVLGQILAYRSLLYELEGKRDLAVKLMRREYSLFPERKALVQRIAELESGSANQQTALARWNQLARESHLFHGLPARDQHADGCECEHCTHGKDSVQNENHAEHSEDCAHETHGE